MPSNIKADRRSFLQTTAIAARAFITSKSAATLLRRRTFGDILPKSDVDMDQ